MSVNVVGCVQNEMKVLCAFSGDETIRFWKVFPHNPKPPLKAGLLNQARTFIR